MRVFLLALPLAFGCPANNNNNNNDNGNGDGTELSQAVCDNEAGAGDFVCDPLFWDDFQQCVALYDDFLFWAEEQSQACEGAVVDLYDCLVGLQTCDDWDAYLQETPNYPCEAEDDAIFAAC